MKQERLRMEELHREVDIMRVEMVTAYRLDVW